MKRGFIILFIHSIVIFTAWTQDKNRKEIREGNKFYESGKSVDAETSYRKALEMDKNSYKATFNLGDALYQQKKFDEAARQFEVAASETDNKDDRAKAYHNLGNSLFQQQKLKESIDAYKHALRNNPKDMETKYNLSYAMNLLKEQEQQQNNQDQDKQDQQDKKDQQDQNNGKDNKDQQDQDQQDKEGKDKKDQQGQDKQDQGNDQKDKKEQKPPEPQDGQGQPQEQQISPEDAQRILDAIAQDERNLQEKLQKKERVGHRGKIEKNW